MKTACRWCPVSWPSYSFIVSTPCPLACVRHLLEEVGWGWHAKQVKEALGNQTSLLRVAWPASKRELDLNQRKLNCLLDCGNVSDKVLEASCIPEDLVTHSFRILQVLYGRSRWCKKMQSKELMTSQMTLRGCYTGVTWKSVLPFGHKKFKNQCFTISKQHSNYCPVLHNNHLVYQCSQIPCRIWANLPFVLLTYQIPVF